MPHDAIAEYRRLVVLESSRALTAPNPQIAAMHEQLAELYLSLMAALSRPVANDRGERPPHTPRPKPSTRTQ